MGDTFLEPGSDAEWGAPKVILMHTPGNEVLYGIIHPKSALFERPFDISLAVNEHKNFIRLLQKNGTKVYTIRNILLVGTIDINGNCIDSKELDDLKKFARQFLKVDSSYLPSKLRSTQNAYVKDILKQLSPEQLVEIILHRPTIRLYTDNKNTGLTAKYEVSALMNLYFLRDQMITTKNGVIIGKLNSSQRSPELKIIKFVLNKLGIKPIYEVKGNGRLEGGDFFSAGDVSFIGQGLRTNANGIKQLLNNNTFGSRYVAVVKDSWCNQEEMHLDTYFNIISPKLAVLVDTRIQGNNKNNSISTLVDVYEIDYNKKYKLIYSNLDFEEYLIKQLKYKVISVSKKEQNNYGINFLTVGPNMILAAKNSMSKEYKNILKKSGVKITWIKFKALSSGYGAVHCITQPIVRKCAKEDFSSMALT